MSGLQKSTKVDADGNRTPQGPPPPTVDAKNSAGPTEPHLPLYWSVLHHKNLHEESPTTKKNIVSTKKNAAPHKDKPPTELNIPAVIHERQHLLSEVISARSSALTGFGSTSDSPPDCPPNMAKDLSGISAGSGWGKVRVVVKNNELLIRNIPEVNGEKSRRWSDLENTSFELTLRECLILFIALLAIGVLAYSFLFENWSIIDALYFTVRVYCIL